MHILAPISWQRLMFRRRQRLLASCGLFLVYVAVSQLAARYSAGPPSETHPGSDQTRPYPTWPVTAHSLGLSGLTKVYTVPRPQVTANSLGLSEDVASGLTSRASSVPQVTANSLGLSEDVAGATLLAAGSSAPELATTTLGVFVTKDDIGISGVIGSAVFNAMLVISLVSLLVDDKIRIKCYPMLRDILCYLISIAALLAVIYDNFIAWYEALALVSMYVLYCLVMWKNRAIERWILSRYLSAPSAEKRSLMTRDHQPAAAGDSEEGEKGARGQFQEVEFQRKSRLERDASEAIEQEMTANVHEVPYDDNDTFRWPDGTFSRVLHVISLPIVVGCYLTMPDVGKRRWRPWYPVTFVVATLWIALFSYLMVWMITVIGFTMNIPDTIMGLSFVAIGVSIPDVLASVAVARDGYGDMAVSNALGSNVFDILFCMGVPWLISTLLVYPGSYVKVDSGGMLYSTVFLFSTVIFLLVATYLSRWTLSKPYGISLLVWYALFLSVACLYEMNFFGQMTLPMCSSLA
ncbi:Sodium/potassium/calcium exchanger 5 [Amphibalanus amphitrite]|uniref:Sodium/potassium/calcium exchanger 5 n=1 Tax=Amphibalanus amphitrite TaxID=1232801 RepID=A0A6A4VPF6_AMPAM|nr:Sodium/potassium/calcium exchanger 5 [Amphibalanus amphitrite]